MQGNGPLIHREHDEVTVNEWLRTHGMEGIAEEILPETLEIPVYYSVRMRRNAGMATFYKDKGIRRGRYITLAHWLREYPEDEKVTMLHEIAHHCAWVTDADNGHGAGWKRWCRKLGICPKQCRYHSLQPVSRTRIIRM